MTEMTKMTGNPFYAKGPVEPQYFADRDSIESRAQYIHKLKPHVSLDEARDAVRVVDTFIEESLDLQT